MKAVKAARRGPVAPSTVIAPSAAQGLQFWHYALAAFLAMFALFSVYGPALNGPFFLDDTYLPYALSTYEDKPFSNWMEGVRPVLMLSYWLNFQQSGQETFSYHVINVLLHLLNGGLIFVIVRKVLDWVGTNKAERDILGVFAAGLFLFHPLQTESVSYIASRSEGLSVFFFLAAFAVFVCRRSAVASWPVAAMVLALFGMACLTKEHAVVLPGLLLLTDYYFNPGYSVDGVKRNWRIYIPVLVGGAIAVFFVLRLLRASNSAGFGLKDFTWYQYFFTECRALWRYLLLFVLPIGQNIDHDFPASMTILDHGALLGLVGLLLMIGAAWYYRRRFPLISYGVFTFLLLLAPTSSFVPIRDTLVERRMYLPFIGFLFVTVGLLRHWKTSRTVLVTTLLTVLCVEGVLSYNRNRLWGNAADMWADSVSKSPRKYRPQFQLAYAHYLANQCPEAVNEFSKAAQIQTPDYGLLVDWALASDCAGNSAEAVTKLQQAAALNGSAHVYSQIGMEYAKLTQYPQALDALDRAVKLDPNFGMTYVYRGHIFALQGNKPRAAAEYQRALEIDPRNQAARDAMVRLSGR